MPPSVTVNTSPRCPVTGYEPTTHYETNTTTTIPSLTCPFQTKSKSSSSSITLVNETDTPSTPQPQPPNLPPWIHDRMTRALSLLEPTTISYATEPYDKSFNWSTVAKEFTNPGPRSSKFASAFRKQMKHGDFDAVAEAVQEATERAAGYREHGGEIGKTYIDTFVNRFEMECDVNTEDSSLQPSRDEDESQTSTDTDQETHTISDLIKAGADKYTWYIVAFRSTRKKNSNTDSLYSADKQAHIEATRNGGLLKYWYGEANANGDNLATCIWESREHALEATKGPLHRKAMALTASSFEKWRLERLSLRWVPETGDFVIKEIV
ncbi:hypothetical protein HDU76_010172 [Blyttiomyces sp. JEL0837]|nr:hypothetical protein HDU76_010172 [Blyttiomyces sp. JEL0837]